MICRISIHSYRFHRFDVSWNVFEYSKIVFLHCDPIFNLSIYSKVETSSTVVRSISKSHHNTGVQVDGVLLSDFQEPVFTVEIFKFGMPILQIFTEEAMVLKFIWNNSTTQEMICMEETHLYLLRIDYRPTLSVSFQYHRMRLRDREFTILNVKNGSIVK